MSLLHARATKVCHCCLEGCCWGPRQDEEHRTEATSQSVAIWRRVSCGRSGRCHSARVMASCLSLFVDGQTAALQLVSDICHEHHHGLQTVARRRRHILGRRLVRQLHRLDIAVAMARHITRSSNAQFLADLAAALRGDRQPTAALDSHLSGKGTEHDAGAIICTFLSGVFIGHLDGVGGSHSIANAEGNLDDSTNDDVGSNTMQCDGTWVGSSNDGGAGLVVRDGEGRARRARRARHPPSALQKLALAVMRACL